MLLTISVLGVIGCSTNYSRGKSQAQKDLLQGKFVEWSGGLPIAWSPEYRQLMQERFGLECRNVGCMISKDLQSWLAGYRSISEPELSRRFGTNHSREQMAEAERIYLEKHPK